MIYHLLYPLTKHFFAFNVVRYITFRASLAFVVSFLLTFFLSKKIIPRLKKLNFKERIDMYGHIHLQALHKGKKGTPTMGGVIILFSLIISALTFMRWNEPFLWLSLLAIILLGALGLVDDALKIKRAKGLSRSKKLIFQAGIGFLLGWLIYINSNIASTLVFPFFKNFALNLGVVYILWVTLVLVSSSNAVNFTDGLDGLAIGPLVTTGLVLAVLAYIVGNAKFSHYLFIPYIENSGELTILCSAIVGSALGFLWFNSYPAEVFMGDVGALALGGTVGLIAVLIKKEFLLIVAGGVFVLEALSVVLQIFSLRLRKKRMFKAAPLHHHFQLLGWSESKIIIRFWIISIIFAVLAVVTLKIR